MDKKDDKKRRNYKADDTDDDGATTDDDLDENDLKYTASNVRENIPVAPITINVSSYDDDVPQMAKGTKNNALNDRSIGVLEINDNSSRLENEGENHPTTKIRMQIDKRLLELLKIPLKEFVMMPVPFGLTVCTRIIRDKTSFSKGLYPVYHMFIDMYNGYLEQSLMMVARRRQKSKKICYQIAIEKKHNDENIIGKVKSNLLGTQFTAYDRGTNPKKNLENRRAELAHIVYQVNPMGFNGPRKFCVVLPSVDQAEGNRTDIRPTTSSESLARKIKKKDFSEIVVLENKEPEWNELARTYQLDFKNRVSEVSVKNFQLVHPENKACVLLQSGRVGENEFTCDFTYPFCPYQAFAIGLSSLADKIGCA